ncbi:ATP-binding protein [Streptomyces sp. NPDC088387]|uniref:ATP-binding protein n=1 Tax=Streptomyces sp. NPDC088387 TaxID=3365859 RepID=UPI003805E108
MNNTLPEERSSFVGRRFELAALEHATSAHRLVTLTGPGGVGKTRLALRFAALHAHRWRDGAWWAELSPLAGDALLVATVADAVGLADHTPRMPIEAVSEGLAGREGLLVLDSCEHLTDSCRDLVADLLTTSPGLCVLVTSRIPLDLGVEHTLEVGPLPTEGENDAMALFTARAAQSPGGETAAGIDGTDPDWADFADAICRRLEGLPLALELAAARLRDLPIDELFEAVSMDHNALAREDPVWPRRHERLRTTIGWSHELCTPRQRLLWARLSVLRDTFDTATAEAVCAGGPLPADEIAATLEALADCSVVSRVATGYRMLDSLREYGQMWLALLGEEGAAADRHAAHFLDLGRRADAAWTTTEQLTWYRRISAVHTDLCAALDHLLVRSPGTALELIGRITFFWSCCGHLYEARGYLERALATVVPGQEGPHLSRALWGLGFVTLLQGQHHLATDLAERCAQTAERHNDAEHILAATYLRGLICLLTGRPLTALTGTDRLLDRFAAHARRSAWGVRCELVRVFALTALGAQTEAERAAQALRTRSQAVQDRWTGSYTEYQLALLALFQDRADEAETHARAMLLAKHQLGDSFGVALSLDLLAAAHAAQGRAEDAAYVSGSAQTFWGAVGHPQRGTPELRPVRESTESSARAALGADSYTHAWQRGARDGDAALVLALGGNGAPGQSS